MTGQWAATIVGQTLAPWWHCRIPPRPTMTCHCRRCPRQHILCLFVHQRRHCPCVWPVLVDLHGHVLHPPLVGAHLCWTGLGTLWLLRQSSPFAWYFLRLRLDTLLSLRSGIAFSTYFLRLPGHRWAQLLLLRLVGSKLGVRNDPVFLQCVM